MANLGARMREVAATLPPPQNLNSKVPHTPAQNRANLENALAALAALVLDGTPISTGPAHRPAIMCAAAQYSVSYTEVMQLRSLLQDETVPLRIMTQLEAGLYSITQAYRARGNARKENSNA